MEQTFRFDRAAVYQQERVASNKHDPTVWYDYALFLMRTNEPGKAEECTREALALAQTEFEYIFAHGLILATRGKLEDAEPFLKSALDMNPSDVELWLLMGLLYTSLGRGRDARAAVKQANALGGEAELGESYYSLAVRCLKVNAVLFIEGALAQAMELTGEDHYHVWLCKGKMLLTCGKAAEAEAAFERALSISRKSVSGWTMLGQARVLGEKPAEARTAFSTALDLSGQPMPLTALLYLGKLSLETGSNAKAKELFLLACRSNPSCTAWLGVGTACLRLGQKAEAEEALAEANVLNNRDEAVWGELALLCTGQGRFDEGEQAIKQALKLGLSDAGLLCTLGETLTAAGKWSLAESCLRRSIGCRQTAQACRLLGDVLHEQQQLEGAVEAYQRALASEDAATGGVSLTRHCDSKLASLREVLGV